MKSALIFLPDWNTTHPYLSLPCLSAYLKENGVEVRQIDLNIEWFWYTCSDSFLDACYEKICIKDMSEDSAILYHMLYKYLKTEKDKFKENVRRSEVFYSYHGYKKLRNFIETVQLFASMAYDGYQTDSGIQSLNTFFGINDLVQKAEDKSYNPYHYFFKEMIKKYDLNSYDFIGFSLIGMGQIIALLSIIPHLDREHTHICIGGNTFSKIQYKIEKNKEIFNYVDSILLFEGEYPLLKLIRALENGESLYSVPNCVFYDKEQDRIVKNEIKQCVLSIENLPVPDYADLSLELYTAPEIILPYYVSRSCYWGKCAFCDHDYGYDGKYRVKSVEKVLSDIGELREKYHANVFYFVDEALNIPFLEKLCDSINEQNKFYWFGYIKASQKFTYDLCCKLKRSGCLFLMVGIESCSKDILEKMNKGITPDDIHTTVENMDKAGLWLHSFMINDFPTETLEDKFTTIFDVFSNPFHSIGLSQFSLPKNAKITSKLEEYGLYDLREKSDLSSIMDYKARIMPDREVHQKIVDLYRAREYNRFMYDFLMDSQHAPLFMKKYDFVRRKNAFRDFVNKEFEYNNTNLICEDKGDTLIVFNIQNRNMLALPTCFKEILGKCNGITDDELAKILEVYAKDEDEYDEFYYVMKLLFE